MKPSLLTFLICLSLVQGLAAQSFPPAFFYTRPGASLRYERREPGTGALSWTHISSIGKAHELADGNVKFDFTTAINSGKMKSPLKGPVSSHVVVHPDGTVEMDLASDVPEESIAAAIAEAGYEYKGMLPSTHAAQP